MHFWLYPKIDMEFSSSASDISSAPPFLLHLQRFILIKQLWSDKSSWLFELIDSSVCICTATSPNISPSSFNFTSTCSKRTFVIVWSVNFAIQGPLVFYHFASFLLRQKVCITMHIPDKFIFDKFMLRYRNVRWKK